MIPARLGSKRIPKKNIRQLDGKPLLAYAVDLAKACGHLSEVWVNSESDILGRLAIERGAMFHKRPDALSTDMATNQEFTAEFLTNHDCDFVVMVNSTSPLAKPEVLNEFCNMVKTDSFDTILSVVDEYAECFYKGQPINFPLDKKINSQDLAPIRKVVWAFTAWRRSAFLDADNRGICGSFSGRIGLFSIPKDQACDLDVEEDWNIAEGMLRAAKQGDRKPRYWTTD